jgi:beta-glucosidase
MPVSLPTVNPDPAIKFPADFRFGVADSDLQVIGEDHTLAEEGSEPTMWKAFTERLGMPTPGPGIDRYHRWREDLDHLKRLGTRHYRTSVSMARTLQRDGSVNPAAIDWYKRYFGALKEAGISIYATLYHWELPQHLNEHGAWTDRATASALQRHAQVVAEHLNEFIDEYFILNEPWCSSMLSYYEGAHAPGRQSNDGRANLKAAVHAAHHLLLAQGLAYDAIKQAAPQAKIGTVFNYQPSYTISTSQGDLDAARYGDRYYNTWFLDAIFAGRYPEDAGALYGPDALPAGYEKDMETIKVGPKLHAFGVNYYRGALYRASNNEVKHEEVILEKGPRNGLGWPVFEPPYYPEGMYDILQQIYFGYRALGLKRLYASENGLALKTPWDGRSDLIDDEPRIHYISEHLRQLHKALLHGIPVEAYFYWTMMDNFEWAEGYAPESAFGLIHVDMPSLTRVWKKSAHWYSEVARTHEVAPK